MILRSVTVEVSRLAKDAEANRGYFAQSIRLTADLEGAESVEAAVEHLFPLACSLIETTSTYSTSVLARTKRLADVRAAIEELEGIGTENDARLTRLQTEADRLEEALGLVDRVADEDPKDETEARHEQTVSAPHNDSQGGVESVFRPLP